MSRRDRVKMKQKKKPKKKKIEIKDLPRPERIRLAKAKMKKVIDHFLYVIELHANNSFVVFSFSNPQFLCGECVQCVPAQHVPDRDRAPLRNLGRHRS